MADYDERGVTLNRKPCRFCQRQFVPESLAKHEPTCQKSQLNAKKRKVFDSSKQRATEDLSVNKIKQAQKKAVAPPRSNWRAKHQDFINTVRAARGVTLAMERGEPLPPPPPPSINPDYVQCPYCSRRFNEKAAERHINFCKEQAQRLGRKPVPDGNAKAKQAARLQYQPPKPKAKAAPGSTTGGYSPVTSSSSTSRGARSTPSSSNVSPANKQGVGRTPPGASNGYSRQQQGGPSTRGRSTGPTGQYAVEGIGIFARNRGGQHIDSPYPMVKAPSHLEYLQHQQPDQYSPEYSHQYSPQSTPSGDYLDPSLNEYQDNMMGLGKALRTGRDPTAYKEARRNVNPSAGNAHLKQTPNSSNSRVRAGGIDVSGLSGGNPSYGYPSYREESDYYSGSETDNYSSPGYSNAGYPSKTGYNNMGGGSSGGGGKFCHECGTKYPVSSAKFCCECGVRRMMMS